MSDLTDEQTNQLELIRPERVIQWLAGALVTDKLLQYAEILEDEYMLRHGFVPVEDDPEPIPRSIVKRATFRMGEDGRFYEAK